VVRGLEVLSIDQFYQVLYRPDLVREKLAGDPDGKVREAAAKLDLQNLLDSGPVPKVAIISPAGTLASDLITVEGSLTDQGGGIGKAKWRIPVSRNSYAIQQPGARGRSSRCRQLIPGHCPTQILMLLSHICESSADHLHPKRTECSQEQFMRRTRAHVCRWSAFSKSSFNSCRSAFVASGDRSNWASSFG
jgi:hypothetical protein